MAKQITLTIKSSTQQKQTQSIPAFITRKTIALSLALTIVYLLVALSQVILHPPAPHDFQHFTLLADGWLHGHLFIQGTPPDPGDFTFFKGHWYVAFPPLPAILMLPLVLIFHLSDQDAVTLGFSVFVSIITIWIAVRLIARFVHEHIEGGAFATVVWLAVFFTLGTELLYVTMKGRVWFLAHVVAMPFVLLYIDETLGRRRAWLAATFLGLAALSRSTTLLTFPFFLLWTFALTYKQSNGKIMTWCWIRQWIVFGAVMAAFVAAMVLYNDARFGSFFDFGYNTMHVDPLLAKGLHSYGQFSTHFLGTNGRFMLVEPPKISKTFPYITFNPFGTGLFWTMPALLFAFFAIWRKGKRWLTLALIAACVLPALAILLYFNTGWYQFGYRFALDFLPFLFLLAALGMASKPTWREGTLITLSVSMNVWGYIVFTYFKPPLLG